MRHAHNFQDLTGEIFSRLTVIRLNVGDHHDRTRWECKCECGNFKTVMSKDLKCGKVKSCGCLKGGREFIDMIGIKFGRLTVTSLHSRGSSTLTKWNCICDCGNSSIVFGANLRKGTTTSCGCRQKEKASKTHRKHGYYSSHERLSNIYDKMISRCHNINENSYYKYGGRGISVCEEWRSNRTLFCKWALSNGYEDILTIDRINNNGNYTPENCRWVTNQVNSQNTRKTLGSEKVMEIRRLIRDGASNNQISKLYGISKGHASNIRSGRLYSNLPIFDYPKR